MSHTAYELSDWQGYLTRLEIDAIKSVTNLLPKDSIIVKIGAGAGTDTIAILEVRQDLVIFSIDILAGERLETTNEHLRLAENGLDQSGNVIRIWGDSKIVGKKWMIPVDWLHIDGDHSYDGLHGDLLTWFSKVKIGGLISFHDYGDNNWPDVKLVVDQFMVYQELLSEYSIDKFKVYKKLG